MFGGPEAKGTSHLFTEEELAWIEKYLPALRQSAAGQRLLQVSLGVAFVVGLIAHVVGYLLRSSMPTGLPGLMADLLYALGWTLWTGVVVVLFVQIIPEAKRRQIERALAAYEAAVHSQAEAGSSQAPENDGTPTAS